MPGGQILVVEDDVTVLRSVARVLEGEGYRVAGCASGAAALAWLATGTADAILLDLMLPGMSGREFLSALHDRLGRTDIPVVVMTGMRGMDPKLALSMGASDMLEKPFATDDLLNKIALALFRAHGDALPSLAGAGPDAGDAPFLVVADQPLLGRVERLLGARGHRVVGLLRVPEELPRLARVLMPRVILLDLHVPGGLAALRRLRAERALDTVPIVMRAGSASAMKRSLSEIRALGAAPMVQPLAGPASRKTSERRRAPERRKDDDHDDHGDLDDALLALLTAPPAAAWPDASMV